MDIFKKIMKVAAKAGVTLIEKALTLYNCMLDKDTPAKAKAAIASALLYVVSPLDAIPDFLPGGYVDDAGVLVATIAFVASSIKSEHIQKARESVIGIFNLPSWYFDGIYFKTA